MFELLDFSCSQFNAEWKGLELFARRLRKGWYSVGNQALMFQNNRILMELNSYAKK